MKITETYLKGCFIIDPDVFNDNRGLFLESYNKREFENAIGRKIDFVQDNLSVSKKGVLRGLHFQKGDFAQAKLIKVLKGEVLDVIVDLRKGSPTYGEHLKMKINAKKQKSIFIPKGMAHGFLTLTETAIFSYKCDAYYDQASESGIFYNDSDLGIDWEYPMEKMILSKKDKKLPFLKDFMATGF